MREIVNRLLESCRIASSTEDSILSKQSLLLMLYSLTSGRRLSRLLNLIRFIYIYIYIYIYICSAEMKSLSH